MAAEEDYKIAKFLCKNSIFIGSVYSHQILP